LSVDSRGRVRSVGRVDWVIKDYMEREGGEKGSLGEGKRKNRWESRMERKTAGRDEGEKKDRW